MSKAYEKLDLDMIWFKSDYFSPWDFARLMGEGFIAKAEAPLKNFDLLYSATSKTSLNDQLEHHCEKLQKEVSP